MMPRENTIPLTSKRGEHLKKMKKNKITIIVGGDYGSEGKGNVAGNIIVERNYDWIVRTGAINAGHTVYYKGKEYKMQLIPVGWVNPTTKLVIGAGGYVHIPTLLREVAWINEAMPESDVKDRLFIDVNSGLHSEEHIKTEHDGKLHERMGSTGEGCAEAAIAKMKREFDYKRFSDTPESEDFHIVNTAEMLNDAYDRGESIMIEGTQGTMLDLHFGHYPYTTSRSTFAGNWAMEVGFSPSLDYEVLMVVRTYPIRVAGNSGPLPNELYWPTLARKINARRERFGLTPVLREDVISRYEDALSLASKELNLRDPYPEAWSAEERKEKAEALTQLHRLAFSKLSDMDLAELKKLFEFTTVTKKLRRIAELDTDELKYSSKLNRPAGVIITFFDYMFPELIGVKTWKEIISKENKNDYLDYVAEIEKICGAPVAYVSVNGQELIKVG